MKTFTLGFLATLTLSACFSPDNDEPDLRDPTGAWTYTARFSEGTCGITAGTIQTWELHVLAHGDEFVFTRYAGETVSGTVMQDESMATILVTIKGVSVGETDEDSDDIRYTHELHLTVDEARAITGIGSETQLKNGKTCLQPFTVTGTVQ